MVKDADIIGPAWTSNRDPRITRVGKVLRKTALDELPELINIWKGEMSFVGPRALAQPEHDDLVNKIPNFADRLQVRPGLTGLSQLYNTDNDDHRKLQYDREYIERMSLILDVKLILLSIRHTLLGSWDKRSVKKGRPSNDVHMGFDNLPSPPEMNEGGFARAIHEQTRIEDDPNT